MIKFFTKRMNNRKGFTLIELIVVVAILGILAALAIPRLGMTRVSAQVSAHNANVRTIEGAAAMYVAQVGNEPENLAALTPKYLNKEPKMPKAVHDVAVSKNYIIEFADGEIVVKPGFATINEDNTVVVEADSTAPDPGD